MNKGIICIETEWEHTVKAHRLQIHTEPLLEFVQKLHGLDIIYRRIATWNELEYYLKRFSLQQYDNYQIMYLSFHGDKGGIFLEGEKGRDAFVSLEKLSKVANGVFENRIVHFSSCETLQLNDFELIKFKKNVNADILSGYTTKVDGALSAINDIAYMDQLILNDYSKRKTKYAMNKYYGDLNKSLGFTIV